MLWIFCQKRSAAFESIENLEKGGRSARCFSDRTLSKYLELSSSWYASSCLNLSKKQSLALSCSRSAFLSLTEALPS